MRDLKSKRADRWSNIFESMGSGDPERDDWSCFVSSVTIGFLVALLSAFIMHKLSVPVTMGALGFVAIGMGVYTLARQGCSSRLTQAGDTDSTVSDAADVKTRAAAVEASRNAAAEKAAADRVAAKAEADKKAAAKKAAAERAAAEKAKADKAAAEKAAIAAAPTVSSEGDYDGDGVVEGAGEGTRPEALTAARGGQADDLKLIKGVGPKLEQLCNSLGFYHFDQVANWTPSEVAWVDANLEGFKGRVSRDDWVAQAKILAAGGETEFSARNS
ncbi:MAG: endonuclease [Paracoccaceae bacterium]